MSLPDFVYHIAEQSNWASIKRHGLLSTSALLDLTGLKGTVRKPYEAHRADYMELPGGLWVRDQRPMPPSALKKCLIGMTPRQWYALINSKVFFWFDVERLNRQRKAKACKDRPQVVITVDTQRLLARYIDKAALTPFNTGSAFRKPAIRGKATFVSYKTWLQSRWGTESRAIGACRSRSHRPVELAVSHAVSDIMDYVISVRELKAGQLFEPVE